jgi:hypothetical protein
MRKAIGTVLALACCVVVNAQPAPPDPGPSVTLPADLARVLGDYGE